MSNFTSESSGTCNQCGNKLRFYAHRFEYKKLEDLWDVGCVCCISGCPSYGLTQLSHEGMQAFKKND